MYYNMAAAIAIELKGIWGIMTMSHEKKCSENI
jgi:hypothetical protein